MRQAGRYMKEFRDVREKHEFFEVCRTPELACEVTLQPIRRFDLDASIIFSDILVVPQAMGMEVKMLAGKGPSFDNPLSTPEDIKNLRSEITTELDYVYDALFVTRHRLNGVVPLIGFCGGPWTLMVYMIEGEGSKIYSKVKKWINNYVQETKQLLQMITNVLIEYLCKQIEAGAQLIQVFESFAGELSEEDFKELCLPYIVEISEKVKARHPHTPLMIFPKGAHYSFRLLAQLSKFDIMGLDWTQNPERIRAEIGGDISLQGNLDPGVLYGSEEVIIKKTKDMLHSFGKTKYIANLGHGMHPDHDPLKLELFITTLHSYSSGNTEKQTQDSIYIK